MFQSTHLVKGTTKFNGLLKPQYINILVSSEISLTLK